MRLAAALLLWLLAAPLPAQTLVAHPGVTSGSIQRNTARAFFYMRLREWPDGTPYGEEHDEEREPRAFEPFAPEVREYWQKLAANLAALSCPVKYVGGNDRDNDIPPEYERQRVRGVSDE